MISTMKLKLYILIAFAGLLAGSCSNEPDDIFGSTATERIEEALEDFRFAFRAREKWVMEYFPAYDQDYGGWIYIVEFHPDNTVKAWFEGSPFIGDEAPVVESDYSVKFSTGPMLTFNTFNTYLHYFGYPGVNGGYQGYEGDHEFFLMSRTDNYDEIIMTGMKTGNRIRMTPLPDIYTPEEYLSIVRDCQKTNKNTTMKVLANGKEVAVISRENIYSEDSFGTCYRSKVWTISYRCRIKSTDAQGNGIIGEDGKPVYENVAVKDILSTISFPDDSMRLYEPYVFKGDVLVDDETIDIVNGQPMQFFERMHGATPASDYYICTDSFIDFRLVP